MADDLNPIQILIEELQDEDLQLRVNAVRRLSTIALALGEERTRNELLPFLKDNLQEEDEIRLAVAEELSEFVPLVGGERYAHTLLFPLQALAAVDEIVVRDKAVDSIKKISADLPSHEIEQYLVSVADQLSAGDFFPSRCSACGIYPLAYCQSSAKVKADILASFSKLCADDTPMVRRAAAMALPEIVSET
eukprot:gene387-3734_t